MPHHEYHKNNQHHKGSSTLSGIQKDDILWRKVSLTDLKAGKINKMPMKQPLLSQPSVIN